jgi:hypothetical protein
MACWQTTAQALAHKRAGKPGLLLKSTRATWC